MEVNLSKTVYKLQNLYNWKDGSALGLVVCPFFAKRYASNSYVEHSKI
jgi:hypothetical protein